MTGRGLGPCGKGQDRDAGGPGWRRGWFGRGMRRGQGGWGGFGRGRRFREEVPERGPDRPEQD